MLPKVNLTSLEFRFLYHLMAVVLMVVYPPLLTTVIFYVAGYLLFESYSQGIQDIRTRILPGLMVFIISAVVSGIVFSVIPSIVPKSAVTLYYPWYVGIMLAFIIACYEESIYRTMLIKIIRNPIIVGVMYSLLHLFTGIVVLKFTGAVLIGYIVFSFLFALAMSYLNNFVKQFSGIVSMGVHFSFLLFSYGIQSIFQVI